jgi:DNA-binding response OmpR family regulator
LPSHDIALVNHHMPGLDGVEVISRIAAEPTIARLPVVLMTAGSYDDDQIATSASAMLPKPIGSSQFYNCLLEVLNPTVAGHRTEHHHTGTPRRRRQPRPDARVSALFPSSPTMFASGSLAPCQA